MPEPAQHSPPAIDADTVFAAVADGYRRELLQRLRSGEATLSELGAGLPISRQAVSKHLAVLQAAGLVNVRAVGRTRVHSLDPVPLQRISAWLEGYAALWDDALARLSRYVTDGESPTEPAE